MGKKIIQKKVSRIFPQKVLQTLTARDVIDSIVPSQVLSPKFFWVALLCKPNLAHLPAAPLHMTDTSVFMDISWSVRKHHSFCSVSDGPPTKTLMKTRYINVRFKSKISDAIW